MSDKKVGAYGSSAPATTSFRRTWDEAEYTAKAKEKDAAAAEYAKEAQEAIAQGKKPPRRVNKNDELPKPTMAMQAREAPLELDKDLNKVLIVQGDKKPGFYCDVCRRNSKDSVAYLDHLNGRGHLKRLGQTTRVKKSTLNDVRLKIAQLREQSRAASEKKQYDFAQRLKEIKSAEEEGKRVQKEARKKRKEEERERKAAEEARERLGGGEQDHDMAAMMGFGGFGSTAQK